MSHTKVILFDANETLVDLAALDPHFARVFGDATVRTIWFTQLLQLFLTATIVDQYQNFGVLADAGLDMVATLRGTTLREHDRAAIHEALLQLPSHQDVRPALMRLKDTDLRLAVLTNSTAKMAGAQLKHAGLEDLFEVVLSADAVERYKPSHEAYAYAAKELDVDLEEIRLVAAHAWDVTGALAAGCRAAFVGRPGKVLNPNGARPDIVGTTMGDVIDQIIHCDA